MEPPKLHLYQLTKNIAAKILPHVSSALRDLGVIFDKHIIYTSLILEGADDVVTSESCYSTQYEQENTHNNDIERDTRREMNVDTDQKYQEKVKAAGNHFQPKKRSDQ